MTPPKIMLTEPIALSLASAFEKIPRLSPDPLIISADQMDAYMRGENNSLVPNLESFRLPSSLWTGGANQPFFLGRMGPIALPLAEVQAASAAAPAEVPAVTTTWTDFLQGFANAFQAVDIDWYNVPVNRGTKLCRYPEYTLKSERPECSIDVHPDTTARISGEIRPIRGTNESVITRFFVDFRPDVLYHLPTVPDLEINGFAAVDPPDIVYDRSFSSGKKSVRSMSGGNYSYEDPLETGAAFHTPFTRITEPPPSGHNYWMFRFSPVNDTVMAGLEETISDGRLAPLLTQGLGALMVWAQLPTWGFIHEERFKQYGAAFNTFPRRFGDLIAMISPLFNWDQRHRIQHETPFLNPNTEYEAIYLDSQGHMLPMPKEYKEVERINNERRHECERQLGGGKTIDKTDPFAILRLNHEGKVKCPSYIGRQPIPDDLDLLDMINQERARFKLTPINRSRGSVIDWFFGDLTKDPLRMAKMGTDDRPSLITHFKMRHATLKMPFGNFTVDPSTDVRVRYFIEPYMDRHTKQVLGRLGLRVDVQPLEMEKVDLEFKGRADSTSGAFRIKADKLRAQKVSVTMPSLPGVNKENEPPPFTIHLEGVDLENLDLSNKEKGIQVKLGSAKLANLDLVFENGKLLKVEIKDLNGNQLDAKLPLGEFNANQVSIPKLSVVRSYENDGKLRMMTIRIPEVHSEVGLCYVKKHKAPETDPSSSTPDAEASTTASEATTSTDPVQQCLASGEHADTKIYLDGSVLLKDIEYYDEFRDNENRINGTVKLSGVINSATIAHPAVGQIKFSTIEDENGKTHPISGELTANATIPSSHQKEDPVPWKLRTGLDLPFVALESQGRLNIPHGSSHLRDGHLSFTPGSLVFEGDISLHSGWLEGLTPEGLKIGGWVFPKGSPNIQNLSAEGRVRLETFPNGFALSDVPGSGKPINLHLDLVDTKITNRPVLRTKPIGKLSESQVIETNLELSAQVEVQNLHRFEIRKPAPEAKIPPVTSIESGPITIHHVKGKGDLWVPLAIWGFVDGIFGNLGGSSSAPGKASKRPDPAPLLIKLPEEAKKLVGHDDFLRLGSVSWKVRPDQTWESHLRDLRLNLHEEGGRRHFGLILLPELNTSLQKGSETPSFDFGNGNFWINVYLNEPSRGGYFRFARWPRMQDLPHE